MITHQITITANAGSVLCLGQTRVWVDALHDKKVPGFSTVTPTLWDAMAVHSDFAKPDLLFFTHCHPDHFSPKLTGQLLDHWPQAKVILPEPFFSNQLTLSRQRERLNLYDLTIYFARLPHEGAQYANVAHYGCILEQDGFRVLVPGDCALAAPELAQFLSEHGPIDAALMDFPWITLPKGRRFIQEYIHPRCLLISHLPFPGDDIYGYRPAAIKSAAKMGDLDVRLLLEPFQQESL